MFKRVLVANRSEIAVRVIRALREMGIESVAVYSTADRDALHVRLADRAYEIGPPPSAESYLRADRIIETALRAGCEAIHPGYGFLAENAAFAAKVGAAGLTFIGPPPDAIRDMGAKTRARELAAKAGVPIVPGSPGPVADAKVARTVADTIGYPVLLKAVGGGGGKGMRVVNGADELETALRLTSNEATSAFGTGEVYIEKYLTGPRHIEIQVLADCHGNAIHLGERECSVQRRHQKLLEETPSVALTPELRARMGEAAVRAAKAANYVNAGTVEFMLDAGGNFYFLEMNTRLQVEHPVTELVTRLDLVKEQLRIAAGEPLALRQEDVRAEGASIECRIAAEDPSRNFLPSIGRITRLAFPAGPGVRVDAGIYEGFEIPIHYDSLIAKLITWGATRDEAIARMERALDEFVIEGIRTNLAFHRWLLAHPAFRRGELSTDFIAQHFAPEHLAPPEGVDLPAVIAAAVHVFENERVPATTPGTGGARGTKAQGRVAGAAHQLSPWKLAARSRFQRGRH